MAKNIPSLSDRPDELTLESLQAEVSELRIALAAATQAPTNQELTDVRDTVSEAVRQFQALRETVTARLEAPADPAAKPELHIPNLLLGCIDPAQFFCALVAGAVQGMIQQGSIGMLRDQNAFACTYADLIIDFGIVVLQRLHARGAVLPPENSGAKPR